MKPKTLVRSLRLLGLSTVCSALVPAHATDLELVDLNVPVVLTPARLKQSLAEVPTSVTIISSDMLERLNISSIAEALRLVPGMEVTQVSGSDYRVNYHGTNILVPRRLLVLIDGMSVYRPALARVDWKELPVSIEDVDRIEITRGPNSAAYGGDAMMGIVNIITKSPAAVEGVMVKLRAGSLNTREYVARYGGKIGRNTHYRVTLGKESDSGYPLSRGIAGHNGEELYRFNARATTTISSDESYGAYVHIVRATSEQPFVDAFQKTYPDKSIEEYDVGLRWNKSLSDRHQVEAHTYVSSHYNGQEWTTCPPTAFFLPEMFELWRANPKYASAIAAGRKPTGGSAADDKLAKDALVAIGRLGARAKQPTCVLANQNFTERRYSAELQDTLVLSDKFRMVSGIGITHETGDGQTYLGGHVANTNTHVFANAEYKPTTWLNINAGGFWEYETLNGHEFSPRLGLNMHLSPKHTLRLNASRGSRLPDIQEQRADWQYLATGATPALNGETTLRFFQSARSKGDLKAEHNLTSELGYFGNFSSTGLTVDARIYKSRLYDLISEKRQLSSFEPTNNNSVKLKGAELQVTYRPSEKWNVYGAYAYLRNYDATALEEQTQLSKHSGSFGVSRSFDSGWRVSLAGYSSSGDGIGQSSYSREDLTVSKTFKIQKTQVTASIMAQNYGNIGQSYFVDHGRTVDASYTSKQQYYITLRATL